MIKEVVHIKARKIRSKCSYEDSDKRKRNDKTCKERGSLSFFVRWKLVTLSKLVNLKRLSANCRKINTNAYKRSTRNLRRTNLSA